MFFFAYGEVGYFFEGLILGEISEEGVRGRRGLDRCQVVTRASSAVRFYGHAQDARVVLLIF